MSKRCTAKKGNGSPCGAWALRGKAKCGLHLDPERAASMGAKHGRKALALPDADVPPNSEIPESAGCPKTANRVRDVLAETLVQVRGRKMDTRTANALAYIASSLLRAIEIADLEARLDKMDGSPMREEPHGNS